MKTSFAKFTIVAGVILCIGLGGLLLSESSYADRTSTSHVRHKMTKNEVLDLLGVMYDSSKPGEYSDSDAVISDMSSSEAIKEVCRWRIAYSRNSF